MAFWIWSGSSVIFVIFGIYAMISKEPVRFWNVQQKIEVINVKKYNQAVAKIWFLFTLLFLGLGIPLLLTEQNSAWSVIPILGGVFWTIGLMAAYTRVEKRYRI